MGYGIKPLRVLVTAMQVFVLAIILVAVVHVGGVVKADGSTHMFSGTIQDSAGNPLPNLTVFLQTGNYGGAPRVAQTNTDSNGDFSMNATAGQYYLRIDSDNWAVGHDGLDAIDFTQTSAGIDLTTGDVTQTLTVPTVSLGVKVLDQNDNPLPGVTVKSQSNNTTTSLYPGDVGESVTSSSYASTPDTTDNDGNATITTIVGTTYGTTSPNSVCALISGNNVCLPTPVTINGGTSVTITQPPSHTFSGTVQDSVGTPFPNVAVFLQTGNYGGAPRVAQVDTDSNGDFSMSAPVGQYYLRISSDNGTVAHDGIEAVDFTQTNAGINLTSGDVTQNLTIPLAAVQVKVLDGNGNPLSGVTVKGQSNNATVSLYPGDVGESANASTSASSPVATDSDGITAFTTIVGTTYGTTSPNSICAVISGGNQCLAGPLTVSGDTSVTIAELTTHTLSGKLQDSAGNPLPNLTVFLQTGNYGGAPRVAQVDTDSNGNFSMSAVAGQYYLRVSSDNGSAGYGGLDAIDFTQTSAGIDLTTGDVTQTLTVPTVALRVKVLDQNGNPLSGITVNGQSNNAATSLYPDDVGEIVTNGSSYASTPGITNNDGTTTLTTIVGTTYGTTSPNSICAVISGGNYCLTASTTVNGTETIILQEGGPTEVLLKSINTGGGASGGYNADTDYYGGTTYTSSVSVNTSNVPNKDVAPQAIYQSSRYGNSFNYTLPGLVAGSDYTILLHFNEPYWGVGNNGGGVGSRVFNVLVNGVAALTNYDIYKTAGGANRAITEEVPVTADANGNVVIQFTSLTDNAIVSGIQLFDGTLPAQAPHQTYVFSSFINPGGVVTGVFAADSQFSGGTTYSTPADVDTSGVTNAAPKNVFQSARYGTDFSYTIPDLAPIATYNVRLDFNEPYFGVGNNGGGVGSRVFNVAINGTSKLSNFDIFATAGGANKAVAKDFTVTSDAQGKITIQFTGLTNNAIVSGIEITQP